MSAEKTFTVFKIEYDWYEGDHDETLLGKKVGKEQFEKDLITAKKFAESLVGKEIEEGDYLGKGYCVSCLPEFYEQIIWYLVNKLGYIYCEFDESITYTIDDFPGKKINLKRAEKKVERTNLK